MAGGRLMSALPKTAAIQSVRTAWGNDVPEWIKALAKECDETSQKRVAGRIGYSAAVVNQVLKRTYKGSWNAVEEAVRGALLEKRVSCPVLDELLANRCLQIQRQPFAATNAQRVRLYRACRNGCPHSRIKEGH